MSTPDARSAAWIKAWNTLDSAYEIALDRKGADPLPDVYWGFLKAAEVLMGLAQADVSVGLIAGDWLEDKAATDAERRAETMNLDDFMAAKANDDPTS